MKFRIIGRLDIKGSKLIKGVHLEGLRVVGDPFEYAFRYYQQGVDELLLIDAVASLYQRNHLADVISKICRHIFVPVTVGGGIRSIEDAQALFNAGADKIAINSAAISNPLILKALSDKFGSQAIVLSVQAKRDPNSPDSWLAMTDNGREMTDKPVGQWVQEATQYGIGEILVTSIDQEGTTKGYDIPLIHELHKYCRCPILPSGGFSSPIDALSAHRAGANAAVVAHCLHYNKFSVSDIKTNISAYNIPIRNS